MRNSKQGRGSHAAGAFPDHGGRVFPRVGFPHGGRHTSLNSFRMPGCLERTSNMAESTGESYG